MNYEKCYSLLKSVKANPNRTGIIAVGVGTAGCYILSHIHRSNDLIEKFIYLSCDEQDFCSPIGDTVFVPIDSDIPRSPSTIRGLALNYIEEMQEILRDYKYLFIVSGLGGNTGSGMTPLLAKIAKDLNLIVVSFVAMPFKFEKNKHFFAGVALRQLKTASDAVVIIDNDSLLDVAPKKPMLDGYNLINEKISIALSKMLNPPKGKEIGIGLHKFIENIREGYAILSVNETFSETKDAIAGAVKSVCHIAKPDQANKAIIYLLNNSNLSTEEVATSVSRLGSLFGKGSLDVQFGLGVSETTGLTAILVASGFRNTKFDDYDPISNILPNIETDLEFDSDLNIELPNIDSLREPPP